MKKIVFTRPDGGVSVIHPVISKDDDGMSEEQALARALAKDVPADAINPTVVEEREVPSDRTFRDAWKHDGGIVVDMPKAREIHKNRLRALRAPLLQALDVDFMRATERGTPTAGIVAAKQVLRDVTKDPRIEAAKTPEDLKLVTLG